MESIYIKNEKVSAFKFAKASAFLLVCLILMAMSVSSYASGPTIVKSNPAGPVGYACQGVAYIYDLTGYAGTNTIFDWTVVGGTYIQSGATITVTWTVLGNRTLTCTSCDPGHVNCVTTTVHPYVEAIPAEPTFIGDFQVCGGDMPTYTLVPTYTNVSYSWGAQPDALAIQNNQISSVITWDNVNSTTDYITATVTTSISGCESHHTEIVTIHQNPTADITYFGITCHGGSDGWIEIAKNTATSPYIYYLTPGSLVYPPSGTTTDINHTFNNLGVNTYTWTLQDGNNCYASGTVDITQPDVMSATVTSTDATCNGANDGIITITTPLGGFGTYQYSDDGGSTWYPALGTDGGYTFSSLANTTYSIKMRDNSYPDCVIPLNAALQINQPPVLNATVNSTNVTCNGANDGTITISGASGGWPGDGYEYNIGSGWSSTTSYSSLAPATYVIQMRDASHTDCVVTLNPGLLISQPDALSATLNSTDVTCNAASDGTITITLPTGGYGNYEYTINGGTSWQSSGSFTGLYGTYNVEMRDADHPACVMPLNAALQINQPDALGATLNSTNVTCNGAGDGTITISLPLGGYGNYEYTINGGTNWQSSGSFTGLYGTYNVKMRDADHTACVATLNASLQITQPNVLSATLNSTNVTCYNAGDGTITITNPLGGYGSFDYTIDGGGTWQSTGSFMSLTPGTYDVQIRDDAHQTCVITLNGSLLITQPNAITADVNSTDISCYGANDGNITVSNPQGGNGNYLYSDDGGSTWANNNGLFTGLGPNTYNVRIKDNVGCTALNNSLVIHEPVQLSATVDHTHITCAYANDGTITISNPAGGWGGYEYMITGYSWQVSGNFTGLTAGTYDVYIRDASTPSCSLLLSSVYIGEPDALFSWFAPANITCYGASDGSFTFYGYTGGWDGYEFSIDGGTTWSSNPVFNNLAPGYYILEMRDASETGCVAYGDYTLYQPDPLSASLSSSDITCYNANDGSITITNPLGGWNGYEYSIDGGTTWQASGSFTGLGESTYNVQMRDDGNTGCVHILNSSLQISQPPVLTAHVDHTSGTCNGASDGTITISLASGGWPGDGYEFNIGAGWSSNTSYSNLAPGTYTVSMRDASYPTCQVTLVTGIMIEQPGQLTATVDHTHITCYGANDGTITVSNPSGGWDSYEYMITGSSWQANGNFTGLFPGSYDVYIRDASNPACVVDLSSVTIEEPVELDAYLDWGDISCYGGNDGYINIYSPWGGWDGYEYTIDGTTWLSTGLFQNLYPGDYTLGLRDASNPGCAIWYYGNPLHLAEPNQLSATVDHTDITCNAAGDGTITVSSPAGGWGGYEYSIDNTNWQGSGYFPGLTPGYYDVYIRDASNPGCVRDLGPTSIGDVSVLYAEVYPYVTKCYNSGDGEIDFENAHGGSGSYEYMITGASWTSNPYFTGLYAGTYETYIRDANHTSCELDLGMVTVLQPNALTATVQATDVTCNGAGDGTITISNISGGWLWNSWGYWYSIDGGTNWASAGYGNNSAEIDGLDPNTYDVWISADWFGCDVNLGPFVITQPVALSATITPFDVTCFGSNDGEISITNPAGGTPPYQYSIDNGTTWSINGDFTNLTAATYDVRIKDSYICSLLNPTGVSQPGQLSASYNSADVDCYGASDGTITFSSPTGGHGNYNYSIDNGNTWSDNPSFTGLNVGGYDLWIQDADYTSCTVYLGSVSIDQPAQPWVNAGGNQTICADQSVYLSGSEGGSAGATIWTTNGSGTFDDIYALSTYYHPSATDTAAHYVTLTLATISDCNGAIDYANITINPVHYPSIIGNVSVNLFSQEVYSTALYLNDNYTWTVDNNSNGIITDMSQPNMAEIIWIREGGFVNVVELSPDGCYASAGVYIDMSYPDQFGWVFYDNIAITNTWGNYFPQQFPLNGVSVTFDDGWEVTAPVIITDNFILNGYYSHYYSGGSQFTGISDPNLWGGVNATDALIIQKHAIHSLPIMAGISTSGGYLDNSPVNLRTVADVNNNGVVNATDALYVKMRVVHLIASFPNSNVAPLPPSDPMHPTNYTSTLLPNIYWTGNGGSDEYEYAGLCYGDVNRSYTPGIGVSKSSTEIENDGIISTTVGKEFDLPVRISNRAELGAATVFITYPEDMLDVKGLVSKFGDDLQYNIKDGKIMMAWSSENEQQFNDGDVFVTLKVVAKVNIPEQMLFGLTAETEFADGSANVLDNVNLKMATITTEAGSGFVLSENYPNPFTATTEIGYVIPEAGKVSLKVYNSLGQLISSLVNAYQDAGSYKVTFDGKNLMSGMYSYTLEVNGVTQSYNVTKVMVKTE